MKKSTKSHQEIRKEEIINACIELYKTLSFKDITIKDIAEYTTFSRPSIYNYFETKEEIFLSIFQKEYELWKLDLDKIAKKKEKLTNKQFAKQLAKTLENRFIMLKLLSMNLYDMEEHSRLERLIELKTAYGSSMEALSNALKRAFPNYTKVQCEKFIYVFMPFMTGIYHYTYITEKQNKAIEKSGIKFKSHTVSELTCNAILKILENE